MNNALLRATRGAASIALTRILFIAGFLHYDEDEVGAQDGAIRIPGMLEVTDSMLANAAACPIRNVLDKVGNKWSLLVMLSLQGRRRRFMEVKRSIGDITQRVLTQTLRNLERDGYVARKVYPTSPPAVEYWLTPLGESLLKPMAKLVEWANAHFQEVMESRRRLDAASAPDKKAGSQATGSTSGPSRPPLRPLSAAGRISPREDPAVKGSANNCERISERL